MANSPPRFTRIALIGRPDSKAVAKTIGDIARFLTDRSHEVLVDLQTGTDPALKAYKAVPRTDMGDQADLAIAIGGDGTMLGLARNLVGKRVPVVGINHGRLGFITDIPLESLSLIHI